MRTQIEIEGALDQLRRKLARITMDYEDHIRVQASFMKAGTHDSLSETTAYLERLQRDLETASRVREVLRWVAGEAEYLPVH